MTEFTWATGFHSNGVDPNEVGPLLMDIYTKKGKIQAELVVRKAKPKSSPLHEMFPWDDAEAAHEYRLVCARNIVRSIQHVVVKNGQHNTEKIFVHVAPAQEEPGHYATLKAVAQRPGEYARVIASLQKQVTGLLKTVNLLRATAHSSASHSHEFHDVVEKSKEFAEAVEGLVGPPA